MRASLASKYFDDVYAARRDPWDFENSQYERDKYKATLDSLPEARYESAFEAGCSIGVLTAQLALRCGGLLSVDVAEAALSQARQRCAHLPQVEFRHLSLPAEFPNGCFDLVLVSEMAYYLARPELVILADRISDRMREGADLVLVHFTPVVPDYPATGDQVHEYFLGRQEWMRVRGSREERYRIDVLRKARS